MDIDTAAEDLHTASRFCRHFEAETGKRQPALRRQVQSAGWKFCRALQEQVPDPTGLPRRWPALAAAASKGEPLHA